MATNTSRTIAETYKNLLNIDNNNQGVDGTLRYVQDGEGTNSALQLSQSALNVQGTFQINGDTLTATPTQINNIVDSTFTALTAGTGIRMTVDSSVTSTARTSTTILVSADQNFANVSVSGSFTNTGSTQLADVSASSGVFTSLTAGGINLVTQLAAVSAITSTNTTNIAAVSALTSVNSAAITSVNAVVANVSALTSVNTATIAAVSALVSTNTTNIAAVSALTSVNTAAVTSINAVVANVSALTSVNSAAITSVDSRVTTLSATLATSIANHLPLTGGTITGTVSAETVDVSALVAGGGYSPIVSLTDAASISISLVNNNFAVTLGGNRTLENPTNAQAGTVGSIKVAQDGTGSRTLSFASSWQFSGGTAPTLSTAASAVDRIDFQVITSTAVHAVATLDLQ